MHTGGILTTTLITAAAISGGAAQVASSNELSLIGAVATQVPALAVLGVVVWVFVKHLRESSIELQASFKAMHEDSLAARHEAVENVKALGEHCHDVQNRSIEVQRESAVVLHQVQGAVTQLTTAVQAAEAARRSNGR